MLDFAIKTFKMIYCCVIYCD